MGGKSKFGSHYHYFLIQVKNLILSISFPVQRQNGLVGKPTRVQMMQNHMHPHTMMSPNERRLVHFDRHHRAHNNLENRRRVMEAQKHAHQISHNRYSKKAYGLMHGNSKPIQQARKMNH